MVKDNSAKKLAEMFCDEMIKNLRHNVSEQEFVRSLVAMEEEIVDPIDQLHMMLEWQEHYTDEFKRKCLIEAIEFVSRLKEERK